MGGVFACVGVLVVGALVLVAAAYQEGRANRALLAVVAAPAVLLLAYLVAKLVYEEIYPCVAVDRLYCNFFSTQYHNLFGWEF